MITNKNNHGNEFNKIVVNDLYRIRQYTNTHIDYIIDIGANIGIFSLMMQFLHPESKIIALEPHRDTMRFLKQNTYMTGIITRQLALGRGKLLYFYNRNNNILDHMFIEENAGGFAVESITLSQLFQQYQIDLNKHQYMIKLDCEGGEKYLLNDERALDIIHSSKQTNIEIHFQSRATPFDHWLTYQDYNEWLQKNFLDSHSITYYASNKHRGYGHYCLAQKNTNTKNYSRYTNNPESLYNHKYFLRHFTKYRAWEITLGRDLVNHFNIKSLVDFGCGCGSYLEGAKQLDIEVQGFEWMYDIIKNIVDTNILQFISFGDVRKPIQCKRFDCALSIETGEHVPQDNADSLVDNLCNATERLVFFTAAPPGQRGTGHINLQPREYWIQKFAGKQFQYLEAEVEATRERWASLVARKQQYLLRNLMVFSRLGPS